jgi:hypothetical protein
MMMNASTSDSEATGTGVKNIKHRSIVTEKQINSGIHNVYLAWYGT